MATVSSGSQKAEVATERSEVQQSHVDRRLLSEMFFTWNIVDAFEKGKADHYYTLTVRNILISLIGFGCIGIIFYLPALFTAKSAQEMDAAGKKQEAEAATKMARNLNIVGLITGTTSAIIFIILIFVTIITVAST